MIQRTESASDAMQREVEARTNKTEKTALESRDEQERLESARRNLGKFGEMDLSYALQFAEQNQNTTFREETFRDALSKSSGLLTRKQTDELSQTYDVNALRSALEDNAKFDDKEKESIDKQLDLVARERQNVADQRLRLTEQRDALVQEKNSCCKSWTRSQRFEGVSCRIIRGAGNGKRRRTRGVSKTLWKRACNWWARS